MKLIGYLSGYIITSLFSLTYAVEEVDSTVATTCLYYYMDYNWGCNKSEGEFKCLCSSNNFLQTITDCIYNVSSVKHLRDHAFQHIMKRCYGYAHIKLTMEELHHYQEIASEYYVPFVPTTNTYPINGTMRANETQLAFYHVKFKELTNSILRSQWFSWGLVFYWVFIISMATLFNMNKRLFGFKILTRYNNWLNRTILIPSMFSDYQERTFFLWRFIPFNFPTRANALVMTIFVIITMIFCGIAYNITLPHPYMPSRWYANLYVVSYRTDLMAMALFPLIYFFGIRNNPFMYLTGLSFTTFTYYHRWCAYICTVLAFIHSIIWTSYATNGHFYTEMTEDNYWRWGIVATTLLFLLIFQAEKTIRNLMYEVFLIIHQLFSIIFIVAMYHHVARFGWIGWVWSMAGIYGFDHLIRIIRIVLHGGIIKARIEDSGNGVMKIIIDRPKILQYQTGNYAFIYFLNSGKDIFYCYQSHPFTVLNNPEEDPDDPKTLVFHIKAHKGVTRVMLRKLLASCQGSIDVRVMLEGPYGSQVPQLVKPESNIVGIAGGLGITAVYSHLYEILKRDDNDTSPFKHKLIWVVRDMTYLKWFTKELEWLSARKCIVQIVVTRFDADLGIFDVESSDKSEIENKEKDTKLDRDEIHVHKLGSKPNLPEIVSTEIKKCKSVNQNITFVGCGPELFNDHLRAAVARNIPRSSNINVEFQSESFVW